MILFLVLSSVGGDTPPFSLAHNRRRSSFKACTRFLSVPAAGAVADEVFVSSMVCFFCVCLCVCVRVCVGV